MIERLIWDESKRRENLNKHGLDFADAGWVLDSRYRLDVTVVRAGELRAQSFSYLIDRLAFLTVVHLDRDGCTRVMSFRYASKIESEVYRDWLEEDAEPK